MSKRGRHEGEGEIDMTPMIDVVFQLIIFFIVAITMQKQFNPEIVLPDAPRGREITGDNPRTFVVEVNSRGWISIHGAQFSRDKLRQIIKRRYDRYGQFPVMIRGDLRTKHSDIQSVMQICANAGLWKVSFVAIKEKKT
jgi:biopolymer transport protein ExbD